MFLTRGALRNAILVLNICIVVVVLSLIALTRLPANLFPNITLPVILVSTTYQGASPQTMEQSVTYPLEQAATQVAGVTQIQSTTRQGNSILLIWFNWGTNLDTAETEVIQNVQRAIQALPTGVNQPFILKFDVSNIPVAQVVVSGGHLDPRALYDLAYNTIAPQVQRLAGVSQAFVNGGLVRELNVNVDPHRLVATGLSLAAVEAAIGRENTLRKKIAPVRDRYQYVLVDTPPSLGLLTLNALVACDEVIIPIQTQYYALLGVRQLLRTLKVVREEVGHAIEIAGVVPTMFDSRTSISKEILQGIKDYFGDKMFHSVIHQNTKLVESSMVGVPVFLHDPASRGAQEYMNLAKEVLALEQTARRAPAGH
jgi:cellulose biosynthesis protein BcsQ